MATLFPLVQPHLQPLQNSPATSTLEEKLSPVGNACTDPIKTAGQTPGTNDLEEVRVVRWWRQAFLQTTRIAKWRERLVMRMEFSDTGKERRRALSLTERTQG